MEFKDYYTALGVTKGSTEKEIKQTFRKLARKHHPDVNPGDKKAEARFKEVNEAYEVLGDPGKRKKYDEMGANWRMYEQAEAKGGPNPFAGQWHAAAGNRGRGGSRSMTPEEMSDLFGETHPFSDFFTTFFGGESPNRNDSRRRSSRQQRHRSGRDVEHQIDLTLQDAHDGTTQRLSLKHGGRMRSVDVRIPAGVNDNSRVRVVGEGEHGVGGGSAGDLFLRVRLQPSQEFERKGHDLHVKVVLLLTTAVLGGEADVRSLTGKPVRLRVPPLTQNGQVFRLKGYGMPVTGRPTQRGDLYARVEVELPTTLSADEREHYEALTRLGANRDQDATAGVKTS